MNLNEHGMIAMKCWKDIPFHIKNCSLDEFIVMPNHIHGIIIIESVPLSVLVGNRHTCNQIEDHLT
jgi:REP element-mobilizing transposase RayT